MCGIVGLVHGDPRRNADRLIIERMCEAILHRGPDDEGVYVDGPVGLGMRRLSIIDLTSGRQPIFNEDRSKVIVFNGEVYNYRELRRELAHRGHVFRTQSDTEVVLRSYEEWGSVSVERLRGMFAFAIWDARARTLFLARDRFGIKPMYVVDAPWGIAFASELKALRAVGLGGADLDWEALDTFFQLGYIPAPATPFRSVRKIEPGYTLTWRQGGQLQPRRYWDLPAARDDVPRDLSHAVLRGIDESVAAHLVSDVPVAAFLSGGLDSSAVVAGMASVDQDPPHAFTARYHGSGAEAADETPLARALVARYGARLTVVDVHPHVEDVLESILYALDEPHADDSAVPTWLLSQAVAAEYKVALTGIGGDELFAGYRRHIGMLLGAQYARLPRPVRRLLGGAVNRVREPADGGLGVNRLKRFLNADGGPPPDRFLAYLSRIADAERGLLYAEPLRDAISGSAARTRFATLHEEGGRRDGLDAALYFDYKTYLADDILALSDRLSMAHSLEVRVPLVDHVLADSVFPLPGRAKIGWGRSKRLLRAALEHRLPREHFRAPKRGFVGPTGAWLRHELKSLLLDELSPERVRRLGYFDPAAVERLLREHLDRRHNREGILWALLCFSVWHRLYLEQPATSPLAAYP
jgi:asparagine synthase (glutamine-hydrolysing)